MTTTGHYVTSLTDLSRARVWRGIILLAAAVSATALAIPGTADAQRAYRGPAGRSAAYDGPWNVVITTDVGSCMSPYSVQIQIAGDRVLSQGTGARVSGSVSRSGNVVVRVSSGQSNATGSGRLRSGYGSGRWSGPGSAGFCRGRWEARRSYS